MEWLAQLQGQVVGLDSAPLIYFIIEGLISVESDRTLGKRDAIAPWERYTRSHFGKDIRDRIHDTETRSHFGEDIGDHIH